MRMVVDTNVAMVADGMNPLASSACKDACILRLAAIMRSGGLIIDTTGLIVQEYARTLGFSGRPGAGRAFVKWAHDNQFNISLCQRVAISCRGEFGWRLFEEFPDDPALSTFHKDDQKFVAVAVASGVNPPVVNAVDSDWWHHRNVLRGHGLIIEFICPDHFREG